MSIIKTDAFEKKRIQNRLLKLTNTLSKHWDDVEKDPMPFLKKAFERIAFLEKAIMDLEKVNEPKSIPLNVGDYEPPECRYNIVNVTDLDYKRWTLTDKKIKEIVDSL